MKSVQWLVTSVSNLAQVLPNCAKQITFSLPPRANARATRSVALVFARTTALLIAVLCYSLSPVTCPLLRAQTETATLSGIIQDPKGGVVPGVEVVLTRVETGTVGTTTTNGAGIYVFTGLEPGHFRLLVRKEGFKEISIKEFELHVQDKLEQNFSLEIGSISERVTVEGNGLVINTTDATVGTVIDRNFAENLPLNGRSFQTLFLLTPGVVFTSGQNNNLGQFSVNGMRGNSNNWMVDGTSSAPSVGLTTTFFVGPGFNGSNAGLTVAGTTQNLVSVDALQEFKIQTSSFSPEFGRQPGGQVSLLTRSGTNGFHGTVFDYLRNDVFDANNWFNDRKGIPKGKERQNDFGGTFSGPLVRDKTFFFFSYEGLRLLQPVSGTTVVPSLRVRKEAATAFQPILNSFPIPDGPEFTDSTGTPTGSAPYTESVSNPSNIDSWSIRIDQALTKRLHLFGRYAYTSSDSLAPALNIQSGIKSTSNGVTLGIDTSINPRINNELRLNYTVSHASLPVTPFQEGGGHTFDTSGLYPLPLRKGQDFAQFYVCLADCFGFADGGQEENQQRQINIVDNTSFSVGTHQLKWGVDYRRLFPVFRQDPLQVTYFVNSEGDLINDNVSTAYTGSFLVAHPIFTNFSLYLQDSWRLSPRLNLTYGLRWEVNPTPGERDGIYPSNVVGLNNPATATLVPNTKPYQTTYGNVAPRLGLAYSLRQAAGRETVLRAGFGVFYDLNSEAAANGYGASQFTNFSANLNNLPFPVPANVLPNPPLPQVLVPPFQQSYAIDPNLQLPYAFQWNVSIEQALGQSQTISASYVASAGERLLRTDWLYNFSPNFTSVGVVRNAASSNYQSLQIQFERRLSRGLQGIASYSFSHSIDNASNAQNAFASLTSIGNAFPDPNVDRGNSDFDLRHSFRAAVTYEIPTWNANVLSKAVLGGWSANAIVVVQTGLPIDLVGADYFPPGAPNGQISLRPNLVPGQPLYLYGAACAATNITRGVPSPCPGGMGFNRKAFAPVPTDANGNPTQVQGTLGRNVLRGFGAWQTDFALHRQFNLTERVHLQFRSEFFNIFNHPNFDAPSGFLPGGSFGKAIRTLNRSYGAAALNSLYQIGGPRSIQLALKLSF